MPSFYRRSRNIFKLVFVTFMIPAFMYWCWNGFAGLDRISTYTPMTYVNIPNDTVTRRIEGLKDIFVDIPPPPPVMAAGQSGKVKELAGISHEKWIVLTTIQYPTTQIRELSKLTEWKIVVVADRKTPLDWSHSNCIFLDLQTQTKLGYSITGLLPYNSYTRKNIGYLFAIEHGARVIYETDDDNCPFDGLKGFRLDDEVHSLIYTAPNRSTVNPYAHFGRSDMWPRGYPLEEIGAPNIENFVLSRIKRPSIQQGLVNMDPDVDAIYRLTQKSHKKSLQVQFDRRLPPVVLPKQIYAPFNSQNTLWHYESFWLMPLPVSTTFRVTDIWRGYWALRLLQEINGTLGFFPPNANQIRNAHNYLTDFLEEAALYKDAGRLVKFLVSWTCNRSFVMQCLVQLSTDMAEHGFWSTEEVLVAAAWVNDLQKIGFSLSNNTIYFKNVFASQKLQPKVIFRPQNLLQTNSSICEKGNIIRNICSEYLPTLCGKHWPQPNVTFDNVLLVVSFSQPYYSNIELMESMYKNVFPHRLYCGPWKPTQLYNISNNLHFSYVEMATTSGYWAYGCVVRAIEMGYSVDGYFHISDDIIMKSWNLKALDVHTPWYMPRRPCGKLLNQTRNGWIWWPMKTGRIAIKAALEEIRNLSISDKGNVYRMHLNYLAGGNSVVDRVCSGQGDVYYIPAKISKDFHKLASVYLKHRVFLELAVPNIIWSFPDLSNFKGKYHVAYDPVYCFRHYDKFIHVCHKVKLSTILNLEEPRKTFCTRWVNETFNGIQNVV